ERGVLSALSAVRGRHGGLALAAAWSGSTVMRSPRKSRTITASSRWGSSATGSLEKRRWLAAAARYFVFHSLAERYAGVQREPGTFPVQYLGASVPQAWAAGSVFHLLRALLGLDVDAHQKKLYIDPVLPRWLSEITLRKLRVGKARVDLRFWRDNEQ